MVVLFQRHWHLLRATVCVIGLILAGAAPRLYAEIPAPLARSDANFQTSANTHTHNNYTNTISAGPSATPTETLKIVTVPLEESARQHLYYFPELLKLALSKTAETEGAFEIQPYPRVLTGARFLAELANGEGIDIIWTMTNPELERTLLRVPVSLLRGLNSHRVFLIRKEDQAKFSRVDSLADLKEFRAGMVSHWPDTDILRASGLPVVTSAHYELLFDMLKAGRVDYFPRGLYEVWQEQELHAEQGLAVEESLMLYYYGPMYFFVNRDNQALADRIERGLRIAIQDGSFDELFFSIPGFERGFQEMAEQQRRVFELPLPQAHAHP